MASKAELPLNTLQPYASSILIVLAALLLGFTEGPWYFAAGLLPALVSFLGTRELLGKVRKANEQKCFLDEQLIQSRKLADIGELSSGIAHEINNPLAIIGQESEWGIHLLQSDERKDFKQFDDLKDSLREITRQVKRCKEITHRLLNFAKIETLLQRVDVNRLIEDMTKLGGKGDKTTSYPYCPALSGGLAAGRERCPSVAAGDLESSPQCGLRHSKRWRHHIDHASGRSRSGGDHRDRHGERRQQGKSGKNLQSLFHDQTSGKRDRPGAFHLPPDHR